MSVRDLIAAAFNKDAASFEDTLNVVMQEKMAAAVQARFSPAVYEEEVDLSEAKGLHDYDWPKSGMDRDATLGDHAHDAIHHGMHARDAIDHIYSAADDHGKKWVNKHNDDLLKTFKSHGLKSESQFDEEDWDEEVDQIDEISGAKLGTYMIKARKSEAELDKKRDDSYDKPNTPENKAERKAISRTLNKRRWGHGKALDKLTGSSFAKVHATEK